LSGVLRYLFSTAFIGLLALPATAQPPAPTVDLPRVEFGIGFTAHGLADDVNSYPDCVELALPCTHGSGKRLQGLGVTASVDRNLDDNVAITADVDSFLSRWDRFDARGIARSVNRVSSLLVGPRFSTGFYADGRGPDWGRFFGRLLAGVQASDVGPIEPVVQVGAGADVMVLPFRGVSFHWEIDERLQLSSFTSRAARRNLSGPRLVLGLVFGPRLVRPAPTY
jgi:hypothetical protein